MLATPRDDLSIRFSADFTEDRPIRTANGDFNGVLNHNVNFTDSYEEERSVYGTALNVTHDAQAYSLHSITALRGVEFAARGSDFSPNNFFFQGLGDAQKQLSQEITVTKPADDGLRWLGGIFLFAEDFDAVAFQELRTLAPLFGVPFGHRETSTSKTRTLSGAVFGPATAPLSDRLDIAAGLRVSHEKKTLAYRHVGTNGVNVIATAQQVDLDRSVTNLSPELSLTYKFRETLMTYAKVSHGFRSGGFNNLIVVGPQFEFDEETAWNYEVGLKSISFDGKLDLTTAVFYLDVSDLQVQGVTAVSGTRTTNAAGARSTGFEIEAVARPNQQLGFNAGISFADARFTNYANAPITTTPGVTIDASDNFLPLASRVSGSVGAEYLHYIAPWTALRGRVDYHVKGRYFFDVENRLRQSTFGLLDARLGLVGNKWSATLWAKNLFDARYRVTGIDFGALLGRLAGAGPPRTYGLEVKVTF